MFLHLYVSCGVAVDPDLPPIWEEVAWMKGSDASLLLQQLDIRLNTVESLWTSYWFLLVAIPYVDKLLRDFGTFSFVLSHLFSAGGRHATEITELLCLVKRTEELHTKVQGKITSPHLATPLIYDISRRWSVLSIDA